MSTEEAEGGRKEIGRGFPGRVAAAGRSRGAGVEGDMEDTGREEGSSHIYSTAS